VGDPPVKPEILDAYEIGFKVTLLQNRMRLNTAAFYYDYQDLQVEAAPEGEVIPIMINAAEAEVFGLELEAMAMPTENLTLNAGLAVTPTAEYKKFPGATMTTPDPVNGGNLVSIADAGGNRMVIAPEWTMNFGFDYRIAKPIMSGHINISGNYSHQDEFYWDFANRVTEDAIGLLSAQIGWLSAKETWYAKLWGRNLADEEYYIRHNVDDHGEIGGQGAPLTFGLTLGYQFNQ
jgi:iron complex outermembrane receptor protein